jgi:hypothetical protein
MLPIDVGERVAGSIFVSNGAMKYLRELSDRHGMRVSGTPGYAAAADWSVEQLKTAGVATARKESFTMPHGWTRGAATARMIAPVERTLRVEPFGWSPGTTAPIRAEIVVLRDATPDSIKADAARIKGKIALLLSTDSSRAARHKRRPIIVSLRDAGVAAVLMGHSHADNVVTAHAAYADKELGAPNPAFDIGKEDSAMIERMAEKGAVTIEVTSASALTGPVDLPNVIGEVRGREKPDEWIVVCAHLDAWDYGTGSQDNGAGVATVLEVARAIVASRYVPRRSLRFALWGGEEQGLFGSRAYVKAHDAELGTIAAVLNTDNGAGPLKGWHTEGRDDVSAAIKSFTKARLAGLGADAVDDETTCDTDHCPFMLAGVPTLNLWVDMKAYMQVHHAPSDTLEKVEAGQLSLASVAVALTAIEIADRDVMLAPRLAHGAVGAILKKRDLEDELVRDGLWKP